MTSSVSTALSQHFCKNGWKCVFEWWWLDLVAFGQLPYSPSFLIRFLHPFIALSLPPLSRFPSSPPFIRAVLACHYMNTTTECVSLCVWDSQSDREMKWACAPNSKWHSPTGQDIYTHSAISVTQTHKLHILIGRMSNWISYSGNMQSQIFLLKQQIII